jgi:esterase/lipase superfamily enzyme
MSKLKTSWHSERLGRDVNVVRWGEVGTPVLFFPTAAADAEECERFKMVTVLGDLLEAQRIKLYSVDSVAGQAWLKEDNSSASAALVQDRFDAFVYNELVPAIRADCEDDDAEIIATGPSIGAFNALAATCRHPDVFKAAICMSGTYDLSKFLDGPVTDEYFRSSPLHFIPTLEDGEHADLLRERFILLTHGDGRWEEPAQSWRIAEALGAKGIPNRVDAWGADYDHDWPTWRAMLPKYLDEVSVAAR